MTSDVSATYLEWLERHVDAPRHPPKSYQGLLRLMHQKEFVWLIPNDDNRVADGLDLRREFFRETNLQADLGPCSVLEVLVALSRRLSFAAGGKPEGWAWQMIRNLELHKMWDPVTRRKAIVIEEILETLIWRNYEPDGQGGFFPLAWPPADQRKIEIWYQMQSYVMEIHTEY